MSEQRSGTGEHEADDQIPDTERPAVLAKTPRCACGCPEHVDGACPNRHCGHLRYEVAQGAVIELDDAFPWDPPRALSSRSVDQIADAFDPALDDVEGGVDELLAGAPVLEPARPWRPFAIDDIGDEDCDT